MRSWRALRSLARAELRQLVRHRWRSLLVILLVAVPVAALVGGSALQAITRPTQEERRAQVLGSAALRVQARDGRALAALRAELPQHARVDWIAYERETLQVPGRRLHALSLALDPDGLGQGMVRIVAGRAPRDAGEVALSSVLLEGLGRSVGDSVGLAAPESGAGTPASAEVTITGEVLEPEKLRRPLLLHPALSGPPGQALGLLVDVPPAQVEPLAARLEEAGANVVRRSRLGLDDGFEAVAFFVIGGLGFFEAALVVAAAFAVSYRRRQRELGLLAANGASVAGLRASLLTSAGVLALLGGALGIALGAGAVALIQPRLDGWTGRLTGAFELSGVHVVGALALGVVTAIGAAALPAWSVTRLPVRVALGGRRPVGRGSGAWFVAGLLLVGLGLAGLLLGTRLQGPGAAVALVIGSSMGVLGFGCASPWLLGACARCAAPLPLAWRLAVRDAGRFRARNGPVVAAVIAGMSLCILLGSFVGSIDGLLVGTQAMRDDQLWIEGPGAEEVARRVQEAFASRAVAPVAAAYGTGGIVVARLPEPEQGARPGLRSPWVACGDAALLACGDLERALPDFEAGRLIAAFAADEQPARLAELSLATAGEPLADSPAPCAVVLDQAVRAPVLFLNEAHLADHGLHAGPPPGQDLMPWVVRLEQPVTREVLRRAQDLAAPFPATIVDAELLHGAPTAGFLRVVVLLSFVTGLVVVFIATSLSAVESAADAQVLFTLGTAPGVLRAHQAARAGYLALLGCALAIPAGLIPALGLLALASLPLEFVMPWPQVAATVIGLPLVAYVGTWSHALLRRTPGAWRRAST